MGKRAVGLLLATSLVAAPTTANAQEVQAVVAVAAAAYKAYNQFTGEALLKKQSKTLSEISAKLSVVIEQQQEMLVDLRELKVQVASITPQSDAESLRASQPTFLSLAADRFRPVSSALDFANTTATYTGKIGEQDWTYFPSFMGGAAIVIGIHKGLKRSKASIAPYAKSYEATLVRWDTDVTKIIADDRAQIASNMSAMASGVGHKFWKSEYYDNMDQDCNRDVYIDITGSYQSGFYGNIVKGPGQCHGHSGRPYPGAFFKLNTLPSPSLLMCDTPTQTYPAFEAHIGQGLTDALIDIRNSTITLNKQLDALVLVEAEIAKAKADMAKLAN